jgi:hypothetical protein
VQVRAPRDIASVCQRGCRGKSTRATSLHFLRHLQRYCNGVAQHLRSVDRERGEIPDDASALDRRFQRVALRFTLPRMLRILLPGYDPAPRRTPAAIEAALFRFEAS